MLLASPSRFAPRYCEIRTEPATVMPEPKLMMIFCTGVTRLMAASSSVPSLPSQYVSVRLYIVCKKLLITTGTASARIAFPIFPFNNNSRLDFIFISILTTPDNQISGI